ncbi:MAG TPA: LuxR family transcriptional regulator [Beijerinckiaceae bacterium]|jgi:LuxR family quorum sensing-dependent transcriptional regulator
MRDRTFNHADEAFSFIEGLDAINDSDGVMAAMEKSLAIFGFENFIITGLPNPKERFEELVVARKWPAGWFEIYAGEDYVRVDPVIRLCGRTVHPFEWAEAPYDPEREPRAREVMRRAADFRMARGFCLPVHGLSGYEACLSMSGVDIDLDHRTKPAIHLMALYAFERVRQLVQPESLRQNPLTPREQEVLTWAAAGKCAKDTAQILGITERTVVAHVTNAGAKLGAVTKTHAVAKAIKHRLIGV